jgi:hypothetical protein
MNPLSELQSANLDRLARELYLPGRLCPICFSAVTLADQLRMKCSHCRAVILPGPISPERAGEMLAELTARRAALGLEKESSR